jgi:outer membrane protein assembly factor BamB
MLRLASLAPVFVGLLAVAHAGVARSAEAEPHWPNFRGPERTDISPDTGLLKSWPAEGPRLVWETAGAGRGYSSLAIADGRVYTLGDGPSTADDTDEYLTCFDEATGKQLWLAKVGPAWTGNYEGTRSTPTVDGERVYVVTPQGVLVCCETASGKLLWKKDFKGEFGGRKGDGWGYSESVLIDGEKVLCTPGGETNTFVALNKVRGDHLWKTDRPGNRGAGHSSPVIATVGGVRVYVQVTSQGPMGVRADDGQLLWTADIERTTAVIPTPIVRGDLVFYTAGYGRGGQLLRQVPVEGGIKIDEVYPLNRELTNKHGGVVLVGEHLYGDTDDRGQPYCAELMTGKVVWKERGSGRGSAAITAADGCLYIRYADGTMALTEATPERHNVLSTFKIPSAGAGGGGRRSGSPSWSHPVVTGGKLYLREGDKIFCYDVSAAR